MDKSDFVDVNLKRQDYVSPALEQHLSWGRITMAGSGFVVPIGMLIIDQPQNEELA